MVGLTCCRTEINWYPGKTLTESIEKMTIGSEVVQVAQTCQSFFNFFATKTHRTSLCLDEDAVSLDSYMVLRLFSLVNNDVKLAFLISFNGCTMSG